MDRQEPTGPATRSAIGAPRVGGCSAVRRAGLCARSAPVRQRSSAPGMHCPAGLACHGLLLSRARPGRPGPRRCPCGLRSWSRPGWRRERGWAYWHNPGAAHLRRYGGPAPGRRRTPAVRHGRGGRRARPGRRGAAGRRARSAPRPRRPARRAPSATPPRRRVPRAPWPRSGASRTRAASAARRPAVPPPPPPPAPAPPPPTTTAGSPSPRAATAPRAWRRWWPTREAPSDRLGDRHRRAAEGDRRGPA